MSARALRAWLRHFRSLIQAPAAQLELERRFPTCRFYEGAAVDSKSRLAQYNVIFQNTRIFNSSLDSHTYVQRDSTVLNSRIGKFCSIASGVNIGLGQHPVDHVSTHPAFYSVSQPLAKTFAPADAYEPFASIAIGNDVWVGQGAVVLDGVNIGDGAVVGAHAVVTRDVAPYAIVGGVPARVLKYRFDPDTVRALQALQWWNQPEDWLVKHRTLFSTPHKLLEALRERTK